MRRNRAACALLFCAFSLFANASGPRWVTGAPYYYPVGDMVVWYTDQPQYFTDAGDLSPYVNHAAADALVAAAAAVWTVPTSRLVLTYGGPLDEDVSSANVTIGANGITFPSDVQSANYLAKQIAVIYDSDGSITDQMLGSGASNPLNCRHAGVTESVDMIWGNGRIMHAILVLNGRCTGPAPEQQLQLQYQLMRAFGRILGIGWSQTNDNVFTGTPRPNYNQALNWPIMHPIDIICGPYTDQCLPQPFTLRPDDIASLDLLYTIYPPFTPPVGPGKVSSLARANRLRGVVTFPNGQGMQGVNVVVHRLEPFWDVPEDWEIASGVTGFRFRSNAGNPVSGPPPAAITNSGTTDPAQEGAYDIIGIPLQDWEVWQNLIITTQPINPLYTGPYSVGPYNSNSVIPSGTPPREEAYVMGTYADLYLPFTIPDAVSSCAGSNDGTETGPSPADPQGWWTGTLCGYGHSAWSSFALKAQRSATIEVTALDEQGYATSAKAMPVIGVWNTTDATGTRPTAASTPAAFNTAYTGMTSLRVSSNAQAQDLRMVIADQRGDGRPDFAYKARLLYADTIAPATVSAGGGTVVITGKGFRAGSTVTVNGVPASALNWSPTTITAVVPSLHDLHSVNALTADITITDPTTSGSTTMTAALTYNAQPSLVLVSAPSGTVFTGTAAADTFTLQAVQADGYTPIAGQQVTFSAVGQVRFGVCGASMCTVITDASGKASTTVTPLASGMITLSAVSSAGTQTASFVAMNRIQTMTALNPTQYIAAGAAFSWTPEVSLADNGGSTAAIPVEWYSSTSHISLSPALSFTDAQSLASTSASSGPLDGNEVATATACAWSSLCTTFSAIGVSPDQWRLQIISGAGQSLTSANSFAPVELRVVDSVSHPIAGAAVHINQTLEPWGLPCPDRGRCPMAPVCGASSSIVISDADGLVRFVPLEATSAEVTNIAAATGSQGFVSLTLQKQP
jgi:hypothetical protein